MTSPKPPSLGQLLQPYRKWITFLLILTFVTNALNLWLPQIIARGIDAFSTQALDMNIILIEFGIATVLIFLFLYVQGILQTYVAEKVGRDTREQLAVKISKQSYAYIQSVSPGRLLTNMTADIDSLKMFVSMAIVAIVSSLITIFGSAILLLQLNWGLGLASLSIVPLIAIAFFFIFRKISALFLKAREVIDWLNKVINESILGASLIRVLHAEKTEKEKFTQANQKAQDVGMRILAMFASLIPLVTFIASLANIIVLTFGGWLVLEGSMTLGQITAFNGYLMLLIFPIFSLGFMTSFIAQASTSYVRIREILDAPETVETGNHISTLRGDVEVKEVSLHFQGKDTLKDISFRVPGGTKTAIIGPTAAGKTQLIHLLSGLTPPTSGQVLFDDTDIIELDKQSLHKQMGLVFQDSVIFNMSLRENIAFNSDVSDDDLKKAIETAELSDFIESQQEGLETIVSERGASLSGGQKQRIMLARALSLNPKVLLLDDFTARVDTSTEQKILGNIQKNYPETTLISVTQKIASIEQYDQIILLMEGEILGKGTHEELMHTSPEYVQIYNSQRSTNNYEVQS